ncbi:MAG: hypothetical protein N2201_02780 [candidate division WOR-3 bacterium]|nr:hypothetical protein [candidate division WOR-3 bacterium]
MRQRILLIILGVVILIALYTFIFRKPNPTVARATVKAKAQTKEKVASVKEKTKTTAEAVKKMIPPLSVKPESIVVETEAEKGKWGTDPFARGWMLSTEITDLRLRAITQSGNKAYALINDQILEAGEMIAGKKIVAIEKDRVILEQSGRTFTLILGE